MRKKQFSLNRHLILFILPIFLSFHFFSTHLKAQTSEPATERFRKEIDTFIQWDEKNSFPEYFLSKARAFFRQFLWRHKEIGYEIKFTN